jgi:hypothetical protein
MNDLAEQLRKAVEAASKGNKVVTIHLFGIEHADRLKGINLSDLAGRAGISEKYGTELRKAVRLAEYVQIIARPN